MLLARSYGRVLSLNVTRMLLPPFPHPVTGDVGEPKTGDGSSGKGLSAGSPSCACQIRGELGCHTCPGLWGSWHWVLPRWLGPLTGKKRHQHPPPWAPQLTCIRTYLEGLGGWLSEYSACCTSMRTQVQSPAPHLHKRQGRRRMLLIPLLGRHRQGASLTDIASPRSH